MNSNQLHQQNGQQQTHAPISRNEISKGKKGLGLFKILMIVIFFVLLIGVPVYVLSNKETSESCPKISEVIQTVTMKEDSFEPETLTIQRCTQVVFKNQDKISRWPASNLHPTHGIYPEFDPKEPVEPGQAWSFVFDKSGKWKYHDHLVPFIRALIDVSD